MSNEAIVSLVKESFEMGWTMHIWGVLVGNYSLQSPTMQDGVVLWSFLLLMFHLQNNLQWERINNGTFYYLR